MWNDEEDVPREEADKDDEPDEVRPNVDRFVVEAEVDIGHNKRTHLKILTH